MANHLFVRAYEGAAIATSYAEILLDTAIKRYGEDTPVQYPDTAYTLPVIHALNGTKVKTLGDLLPILNKQRSENIRKDYTFEGAKKNGEAALYSAEIIEALRYLNGKNPFEGMAPYTGFISDPIIRKFGVPLVDGTIPGVAVLVGKARSSDEAAALVKDLQSKGMMIFACNDIIEQLLEKNINMGSDHMFFPVGNFTQVVHAANFALRAGLMFGNVAPGNTQAHLDYQKNRVFAYVLALGKQDEVRVAAEMACAWLGFPTIADTPFDGEDIPDWYIYEPDYKKMVQTALEVRGIKLKIVDIPVPITIGPAFEGETIRKADTAVEMGGGKTEAFELVQMVDAEHITDGKVTVFGPELDQFEEGSRTPFGMKIKIYGRKMQEDFEGVLERRVHYFINYGEGLWHVAQRDLCWLRISKEAKAKGFMFKDYGEILIAKYKSEFPAIVDRVEVEIYTDPALVSEHHAEAKAAYKRRDDRLGELTDESVDTFYSCTLCQSFAPTHVCVVSPERVGLCGAVSWLDAKASFEINPAGPNQPIVKGEAIDEIKGRWQSVNEFVATASQNTLDDVALYTLMESPMTSCGCFESIIAIVPECNGLMVTTREHSGMTPCGMTFSTLAGTVGGGIQSPGFMGIGKKYLASPKFLKADGGIGRIVWMPKALKDEMRDEINNVAVKQGLEDGFADKIADETIGITGDEIMSFLEEKGHPALTMDPLM